MNMIKQSRFNEEMFQIVLYFKVTNHKCNKEAFWLEETFGPQCTGNKALYCETDCVSRFMIPESHLRAHPATSAAQDTNTCF